MLSELRTSKLSPHKYYELCQFLSQIHVLFYFLSFVWILELFFVIETLVIVNLHVVCFSFGVVVDMRAFDQLRKLEMFFEEEARRGCSIIDLYELVQHAGNILPRL